MITRLDEVLKLERPLIGVDLETTGVNPKCDGIVELALEIMVPGQPVKEYRTLVNPLMPIPAGATKVHGITNDMVKGAPTFKMLSDNLIAGFVGADFVGYNCVTFDLPMLVEEFRRAGKDWSFETAKVIDAFRLWQIIEGRTLSHAVDRWLKGNDREAAEIEELGGDDEAHNALWDIKMSTRVTAAQLLANPKLPRTVDGLHLLLWPDRFDAEGKLRWRDGYLTLTFGEHKGKPLHQVPKSYLSWIAGPKGNFSPLVKMTCGNAMRNVYPPPPETDDSSEIAD